MNMKKKIVMQLLTMCMVASLAIGTPVVSYAENTGKEITKSSNEEKQDDIIEITKDSIGTVIYDENDTKVTIQDLVHKDNSGNPFFEIDYKVENNSSKDVWVEMYDSYVEDFKVGTYGGNKINAGKKGISDLSIWEKDYKSYDIDDFEIWESKIKISNADDVLLEKAINIHRDAFSSDSDTNDDTTQEDSDGTESTDKDNNSDIEARLSALEEKNKELESQYNDLKEENDSLKKKNKKLKKQVKELQASQNESDTETTQEETTSAADAEVTEVPTENTQPVTEYKDATTIRIVQQALNEAGYNCGTPDGLIGGKTTEAITAYQTQKGIMVNGLVTDELLQSLGVVEKVQEAVKAEASKGEYNSGYTYDQLARNPDTYKGQKIKITGKVLQAETSDSTCYARIAMNSNYDTVIFVTYDAKLLGYRLLEDDQVAVYGKSYGVYSYEAVSGATITIPWIHADIIEM